MRLPASLLLSGAAPRLGPALAVCVAGALLAGCASAPPVKGKRGFSPSAYGVSASPRVVEYGQPVPRGGGREMVGDPYTVAGKVYRPKLDPHYSATGTASWYGDDFHGRLTANGEIYDMDSLSAAHPTMPLPSYARVTNLQNGRSVLVRVNDRGPYVGNRVIDLSARAADMLDVKDSGLGRVKVDYVAPARLDGRDEAMLMASYKGPGNPKTMLAMNRTPVKGPDGDWHPTTTAAAAPAAPSRPAVTAPRPAAAPPRSDDLDQLIYGNGVTVGFSKGSSKSDPISGIISGSLRSYAEEPAAKPAQRAISAMVKGEAIAPAAGTFTPPVTSASTGAAPVVLVGAFGDAENAKRIAAKLSKYGKVSTKEIDAGGRRLVSVQVEVDEQVQSVEGVVAEAIKAGAAGAHRAKL